MPTTRPFEIKPVNAATTIASRYARSSNQPDPAPEPSYKDDILDRINAEQNIQLNDGPTAIIDVQPDYRYPLCVIIYHVTRIYATLDQRNNPLITPATLTAYCLAILYGFALITDSENVRTNKSDFANDYADMPNRRDLLTILERAYVPPFMHNLLTGLMPTYDPRRPKILFCNSLAGFNLRHDYGRTPPITAFLRAHHLVATNPSNTHPDNILSQWIKTVVLNFGTDSLEIGQIIGAGTSSGTYNNWLQTRIRALFNPVTSRSNTNRPTFSPLTTFAYASPTNQVNPYIYLLGADQDNVHSVSTFLNSMSTIINEQLSGSKQLGSLFDTPSGVQILTHFHHGPALPTWHWFTISDSPISESITATSYATKINFLTAPSKKITAPTALPYPEKDDLIDTTLYLVDKPSSSKSDDEDESPILFDSDDHVYPDVRYFDPYDYSPSKLVFTLMNGLCIETQEIDGFTIPQPNPAVSLSAENSLFLNSAIPLNKILRATTIGAATPIIVYPRATMRQDSPPTGVSLYDLSNNRLPYFNTSVNDTKPSTLYGFKAIHNVKLFSRAFSYFGFKVASAEITSPPNVPDHMLYAWSSYRYVNTNVSKATPHDNKVLMLLNFRTLYGTNVTMSQSVHPALLIPNA